MKRTTWLIVLLLPLFALAQRVQLIVPEAPVVIGTAFQVQYICTEPAEFLSANTPQFDSCRVVSGPNYYKGNAMIEGRMQPIQNITFTLVPTEEGEIRIGRITIAYKTNPSVQSNEAIVKVVAKPNVSFSVRSNYTDVNLYASASPREQQRILQENLFVTAEVDKRTVYEGEPVTATFKLYSRLQSSSEAEKSPSFYGFSVVDVLAITESHGAVETRNGQIFNTSVLRKVQLYPVQSGALQIDPMYVENEVEFTDSSTGSKFTVSREIITPTVAINVKPLPSQRPEHFTGAVGRFTISAALEKKSIALDEQGKLLLTISGAGNFIQLAQPVISLPAGVESFDAFVNDRLDRNAIPMKGSRVYSIPFAADSAGTFVLPPVAFSYFNPASGRFETARTDSLQLAVTPARQRTLLQISRKGDGRWWLLLPVLLLLGVLFYFTKRKKKKVPAVQAVAEPLPGKPVPACEALLALDGNLPPRQFYLELKKGIAACLKEEGLSAEQRTALRSITSECDHLLYAMEEEDRRAALLERLKEVFRGF